MDPCGANEECTNTHADDIVSYICTCMEGYELLGGECKSLCKLRTSGKDNDGDLVWTKVANTYSSWGSSPPASSGYSHQRLFQTMWVKASGYVKVAYVYGNGWIEVSFGTSSNPHLVEWREMPDGRIVKQIDLSDSPAKYNQSGIFEDTDTFHEISFDTYTDRSDQYIGNTVGVTDKLLSMG